MPLFSSRIYGVSWARQSTEIQDTIAQQHLGNLHRASLTDGGIYIPDDARYDDIESRSSPSKWAGFQQLRKRIMDPNCRYVFTWQDSRLFGDMRQFIELSDILSEAKVKLVFQNGDEADLDSDPGQLMGLLKSWLNEQEVKRLRARVRDTHQIKARSGKFISRAPYGVDVVPLHAAECGGACNGNASTCDARHGELSENNTVWVINPQQHEAVRMMFEHLAANGTWADLERRLAASGFTTRERVIKRSKVNNGKLAGGRPWIRRHIQQVIRNEFYKGVFVWNKTLVERPRGRERRQVVQPVEERISTPHALGALVEPELWDKANEVMARRSKTKESRTTPALLWDGLVKCGRCGWSMSPYKRSNGAQTTVYDYRCNGRNSLYSTCNTNHIVPERLLDYYAGSEMLNRSRVPQCEVTFSSDVDRPDYESRIRLLSEQLSDLGLQRTRAKEMELRGRLTTEEADEYHARIDAEERTAQQELETVRRISSQPSTSVTSSVPVELRDTWALLRNDSIPLAERRTTLSRMVERVIVDRPSITYVLRTP